MFKLNRMFHKLLSPESYYRFAGRLVPWLGWSCAILMIAGLIGGLWYSPPDYQQGESVRIIYVHVPAAWLSLFGYMFMAGAALVGLVWHVKVAESLSMAAAPVGASFTFLALVTGSLWGKPMWGTFWVWDARLTSELVLLFLYLGVIALYNAVPDVRKASRAAGILALVGAVNVPIVHYSVEWWYTLHQGPTVTKLDAPSIDIRMLIPLLLMALASTLFFLAVVFTRARADLVRRERDKRWVRELVTADGGRQ